MSAQSSRVLQNFFMACFAIPIVGAFLMSSGMVFHSFAESILKLSVPAFVLAVSFHNFSELGLSCLSVQNNVQNNKP